MSIAFVKNFFGLHCTDFEQLSVPRPRTELVVHVTMKSVQTGVVLGSAVGAAAGLLQGESRSNVQSQAVQCGLNGALIGLVAAPLLTLWHCRHKSHYQIYDKCYRLRFNKRHQLFDRVSFLGAVVGSAVAGPTGFVLGVDCAVIGSCLYCSVIDRKQPVIDFEKMRSGME